MIPESLKFSHWLSEKWKMWEFWGEYPKFVSPCPFIFFFLGGIWGKFREQTARDHGDCKTSRTRRNSRSKRQFEIQNFTPSKSFYTLKTNGKRTCKSAQKSKKSIAKHTNIAPNNGPSQKETHLPTINSQVQTCC